MARSKKKRKLRPVDDPVVKPKPDKQVQIKKPLSPRIRHAINQWYQGSKLNRGEKLA